jgi:hypothetical protein
MASRAYSTPAPSARDCGCSPAANAASLSYTPGYLHRALAHLATGSLPPLPLRRDLTALAVPVLAALLGFLAGGRP